MALPPQSWNYANSGPPALALFRVYVVGDQLYRLYWRTTGRAFFVVSVEDWSYPFCICCYCTELERILLIFYNHAIIRFDCADCTRFSG